MYRRGVLVLCCIGINMVVVAVLLSVLEFQAPVGIYARTLQSQKHPGDLDLSFGASGTIITNVSALTRDSITKAVIQPDGKIVVAGNSSQPNKDQDIAVARFMPNGQLDATFGSNGLITASIGITVDYANGLALHNDGGIVVAGYTKVSSSPSSQDTDIFVTRYSPTGTLDLSFGNQGVVTTSLSTSYDQANAVVIQPDGKIIVAGITYSSANDTNIAVIRYTSAGALDPAFGISGVVTTTIGDIDYARDLVVQSDNKILVAGVCSLYNWSVVRYLQDGALDTDFNQNGIICSNIVNGFNRVDGLASQTDGKVVAVGSSGYGSLIPQDTLLVRYTVTGSLDSAFNNGQVATLTVGTKNDYGTGVAIQSDDKIVVGGWTSTGSLAHFLLARYTASGVLDTSFGSAGLVTTTIGNGPNIASSIAIQADNKIVLAGYAYSNAAMSFAMARYYSNLYSSISDLQANNSSPTVLGDITLFTATITSGDAVLYEWNFGDGNMASGAVVSHTYQIPGTYTAIVTATNDLGSVSNSTLITMVTPPVKVFLPTILNDVVSVSSSTQ